VTVENRFEKEKLSSITFHDNKSVISILDHRKIRGAVQGDGEFKETLIFGFVQNGLEEISSQHK
jgi:hypothetical protein